ncbi:hypothetical protein ACS0TY_003218 [Phlomoides rotata]
MQEKTTKSIDSNMSALIPWSCETNWVIAQGSLKDSVTLESSDNPINEFDPGCKSPLILKPPLPDSGPCEIKICFEQKYEVGQVYVRSTARTYEIYYTASPRSINEYLCTVRCGVAVRDDEVLQTNSTSDVAEERGEGTSGDIAAETVTNGGNSVTSEDDWINVKVPEDFYEATAEISDSDACLSLTIRLLSLQEKGHVYLDEIYVFVEPVETTDSGNEALMAGSSTQSSLLAMFMPTLLQISKSGINRVEDKCASDEVIKDGNMETGSRVIDKVDHHRQLDKDTAEPSELEDLAESSELQHDTSAKKCADEPKTTNELPPGRLEIALEQVVSRLSRVEDICLRFEEKIMKPIESMEARLQKVENQLEKLVRNSHDFGLPHCTRICAPAFSCSGSDSSSINNDQSEYPPHGTSDLEKSGSSCNHMPELSHDVNFHPGLVVSAPEFSCGEDEEENDDLNPLQDSPCINLKKTLSLESAWAASLDGFLATATINASEQVGTTFGLSSQESFDIKAQESPASDNGNGESTRYAQVLTVKAPDFTVEETGNEEERFNYSQSYLDTASVTRNEKDDSNEMVPLSNSLFTSTDMSDFGKNGSTNGDCPAVSVNENETRLDKRHLGGSSEVNMIKSYFEGVTNFAPAGITNSSISDVTKSLGRLITDDLQGNASGHESENDSKLGKHHAEMARYLRNCLSETLRSSSLDFQYPILEVKFSCDMHSSTKSSIEALLGGAAESNTEAHSIEDDDSHTEQADAVITNGDETVHLSPTNYPLVDVGVSAGDDSCKLEENVSYYNPEMNASLI